MNRVKFFGLLACVASLACACNPQPAVEPADDELILAADKNAIDADGEDTAIFTVTFNGEDVTDEAVITNVTAGEEVTAHSFASTEAGTYTFVANYNDVTSNELTITVATVDAGLVLAVDKETISNDGADTATFTVTYNGTDVTTDAVVVNQTLGERMEAGEEKTFTSSVSGTYTFMASYDNMRSEAITVTVAGVAANPLVLRAVKPRIAADGSDATTFVVTYAGEDVTDAATIRRLDTDEVLTSNSFSYSGTEPTVDFVAEYQGATSETINVGFGDFYKHVLMTRFTGAWCGPCTQFSNSFESARTQYPDVLARIVQLAIHSNGGGQDPFVSNDFGVFSSYFGGISAFPTVYFDLDMSETVTGAHNMASGWSAQNISSYISAYAANGAKVGIAMSSVLDGERNATVTVRVTPSEAGEYYLAAVLVEDGRVGTQSGVSGPYTHNDIMWDIATPVGGESLGQLTENVEVSRKFTFSLNNYTDNCRVVAYVTTMEGESYAATNATSCPVNGMTDYLFVENAE